MCEEKIACPICGDKEKRRNILVKDDIEQNVYRCPDPNCQTKFYREDEYLVNEVNGKEQRYKIADFIC